jgi:hypothetical protein
MNCIVCNNESTESFQTTESKTYWNCKACSAKFLDPSLYIEPNIEKERYLEHDNRIDQGWLIHFKKNFLLMMKALILDAATDQH